MTLNDVLVWQRAIQDQEIAAGVNWLEKSNRNKVLEFIRILNEATPETLRGLDDKSLQIISNLAMIGLCDVCDSCCRKQMDGAR